MSDDREAFTVKLHSGGWILATGDPRAHAEEVCVLNKRFPRTGVQLPASTDNL